MDNSTKVFGHELLGRDYVVPLDLFVGGATVTVCSLQLFFGSLNIWLIWKVNIFHNAFGTILVIRTVIDLFSSTQHITYSAYVTLSQRSDYSPILGVVDGYLTYALEPMSCALHVLLAANRYTCVYLPLKYNKIFSRKNFFTLLPPALVIIPSTMLLGLHLIPCNMLGYSASYYGYIMLDCPNPGQERPFHFARFIHISCGTLFCSLAILLDSLTIRKLYIMKKNKTYKNQAHFRVQCRFTMQSFTQNIPMFLEILFLSLSDDSRDTPAAARIAPFLLIRFTNFINSTTIFVFNPEARSFLRKRFRVGHTQISSSGADSNLRLHGVY
ncbi:hypothetical protein QR680_016313 [Steinernema hermaphroditum]|uniref:7TM GPCR serpentine receptor class x (Srx) domain-containing protein n=1 Tax=Steinernema hermaphroditum TaxID=289476 RepID=A0AA39HAT1_9BILA|nr:hypothetical protein QR680_016313 [Steinernema hermaphroditum]